MGLIQRIKDYFGNIIQSYTLRSQIIVGFALLTIFSVTAVGLTVLQINYRYLENEKRVQSISMVREFFAGKESEISNMTFLASTRPSLVTFFKSKDSESLENYLSGLQESMPHIDTIVACDETGYFVSVSSDEPTVQSCDIETNPAYTILYHDGNPEAWLLRGRKVYENDVEVGKIVLGMQLDDELLIGTCAICELYVSIINNGEMIASSFGERYYDKEKIRKMPVSLADDQFRESFVVAGHEYYVSHLPLSGTGLDLEIALDVTSIHLDQRQQELVISIVIIIILLLAVLFAAFMAQRIQRPLAQLVRQTNPNDNPDLRKPIQVNTQLYEVMELSQVLEEARSRITTAMNSLQKEIQWSDLLLKSMAEGIITLEQEEITYFSPGAERITGWQQEEVIGRSINEVLKSTNHTLPFLALFPPSGEKLRSTFRVSENKNKILAITLAKLPSGNGHDSTVLVMRDVSEEEALSNLLGTFLGNITHEFRTPLTAVAASIEILLSEADDLDQEEIKELLRSIHLSTLNLENLIDNLLEGSSIETGRFHVSPHPTELRGVIATAVETIEPLLTKYDQQLLIDIPEELPLVMIDARRINQVLLNLLSNASKYGPVDSEINLSIKILDGFVEIGIGDRGPGIPKEYHNEIFAGYVVQPKNTSALRKGTGLGLSVSSAIVKAHGGQVGVRDHAGGGSEFWFTIPVTGDE